MTMMMLKNGFNKTMILKNHCRLRIGRTDTIGGVRSMSIVVQSMNQQPQDPTCQNLSQNNSHDVYIEPKSKEFVSLSPHNPFRIFSRNYRATTHLRKISYSGPMVEGEILEKQQQQQQQSQANDQSSSNATMEQQDTLLETQLKEAVKHHQSLLNTTTEDDDESIIIESLETLRELYEKLQYWDDAIATQETLLQDHQDYLLPKQQSDAYGRIGRYYLAQNPEKYWKTAQKYSQMSLDILLHRVYNPNNNNNTNDDGTTTTTTGSPTTGDMMFHADIGRAYNDLATIMSSVDLEQSKHYLERAEDQYRFHGLRASQLSSVSSESSLEEQTQAHPEIIKIYENYGLLLRMMGHHEDALHKYRDALDSLEHTIQVGYNLTTIIGNDITADDKRLKLQVSIADCYQSMDELGLAQNEYERIMEEYFGNNNVDESETTMEGSSTSSLNKRALEGVVKHNLGQIYSQQGHHEEALEAFMDAYHVKRKVAKQEHGDESHPEVAKTLNGIGAVHATLGNTSEALSYFRESLLIARIHADPDLGDNDPNVLHALRNIAIVKGEKPPTFTLPS